MSDPNAASRYSKLLEFLGQDPDNLQLLGDTAVAAREAGAVTESVELLERYETITPLPPPLLNLRGLLALDEHRFADAVAAFQELFASNPADPALRFNLAWSKALLQDYDAASELLDDVTVNALPHAAVLKIEVLHHLGELEEALALGQQLGERFSDNRALMSALAVAALDLGEADLARAYAMRAGDTGEGLSTMGMLMLNEGQAKEALLTFSRALEARKASPRALLGQGLSLMALGEVEAAAPLIDRSARVFRTHLGSWVAAGWAYICLGTYGEARKRFETVVSMDDSFAEGHGGLAVIDALEGNLESADRRCRVTLRLDQSSFSGALAKSLIASGRGNPDAAARIRTKALDTPVAPGGQTLAEAVVAFGRFALPASGRRSN